MMAELSGVQILQNELEKSKEKLKEFNDNIKKLTGHENARGRRNFESQDYDDGFSGRMGRGRGRIFGIAKRGLMEDSGPPVKRRVVGGAFSRLGPLPAQRRVREDSPDDEDQPKRLSVHSSVVATSREAKNRQDIMQEQTKDKEGMQRNRRMFGLLLGTLNKFKTDSKTMESKEEQRRRIDKKLEENAEKEKKKFKQETMQLMEERHLEETRISRLEQKMEVVQEHADREKEIKKLKNFLCTKTKPKIFWKPRQMNTATENKLKDSIKVVDEMLRTSQDRLEKEIKDVMDREQKREERIKMRLREDGLFLDEEDKDKGNNSIDKIVGVLEGKGDDGGQEKLRITSRLDAVDEKISMRKMKAKRRVVVEEHSDRDDGVEDEDSCKGEIDEEVRDNSKSKESAKAKIEKDNDDHEDKSDSVADSDTDKDSKKAPKKEIEAKDKSDDDKTDDEESSRVVMYRENSKDKDRSSKDRKRGSENERNERRSRDEKHSRGHHHSKHSKRDKQKTVVKEERDEKHEKRKSKSSDRTVVEEGEGKKSRNPTNLLGEEGDVEMESENNVTM